MVRFKNRYLLTDFIFSPNPTLETDFTSSLNERELVSILRESLVQNFGDIKGGSIAGGIISKKTSQSKKSHLATDIISVKYFSPTTRLAVIRCSRDSHKQVWAALTLLRSIKGHEVIARVIHISGERCFDASCQLFSTRSKGTIRKTQYEAIKHNRQLILRLYQGDPSAGLEEKIQAEEAAINDLDI
jgi:ribonuclease P/MRP protein subunit POP5